MHQKRVAAIHDISCFGKCSVTVALPIISACGIETAVIPTAILSTHTGGFKNYTFRDLTEDILPVVNHWKSEGITLDAIYTGYLGSKLQINVICNAIDTIADDKTIIIVDPVMADNGKLYAGFDDDFPVEMIKLCKKADIITPNITEACFMTNSEYKDSPYSKQYIESLLLSLYKITKNKIVLTGVCFNPQEIGAAIFDGENVEYIFENKIPASYHGTGDIFASTLTGCIMNGKSLKDSVEIAVKFTAGCIKITDDNFSEMRYGVNFEEELPKLLGYLGLVK